MRSPRLLGMHPGTTLVAAVALAALTTSPAVAGTETHRDPSGDMRLTSVPGEVSTTEPAPRQRVDDIVGTRVVLGRDLEITTTFRSLEARHRQQDFTAWIKTSEGRRPWLVVLSMPPKGPPGAPPILLLFDPDDKQVSCGDGTLRRPARTVTLTVPATCLGKPSWVRVGSGSVFHLDDTHIYYDDARTDGVVDGRWNYGRRVTSG